MALFRVESRASFRSQEVDVAMTLMVAHRAWPRLPRRSRGRRDLWAEMAVYDTQADRLDLKATLDHYADDDTEEIRWILSAQASHRPVTPPAASPIG